MHDEHDARTGPFISPELTCSSVPPIAAGKPATMPRQDDHRDAVAHAALGDLLAEPHQEHRAGGQRHGGHEHELRARGDHDALVLERDGRGERLERASTTVP